MATGATELESKLVNFPKLSAGEGRLIVNVTVSFVIQSIMSHVALLAIIPQHGLALWLTEHIRTTLDHLGLKHGSMAESVIYVGVIVAFALLLGWLVRRVALWLTRRIMRWRSTQIGNDLIHDHVLSRCSHVITPLVILALLPFAFDTQSSLLHLFRVAIYIYTIVAFAVAINAVIRFFWMRYNQRENTKNLALGGIRNLCTGIVWVIAVIVIGSIILDKSPVALLTGLGAFAAALMLIFKDTILGFVAGVQLSGNDMLRIGDWIVVPSTIANGIVVDMSLTAVKVQNWDNTIVTLPPYTLVSTSFQNWRGMSDSGYRLISRSVIFDVDSVVPCTDQMIQSVSTLPGMKEFIDKVKTSGPFYDPGVAVVNGTIQTNLGLLRAYLCYYLLHHPLIGTDQQILVNVKVPEGNGFPLQIYCYTTTAWTAYEAVQSEIFEHIAAVAPKFGLRLYNAPSGNDVKSLARNV